MLSIERIFPLLAVIVAFLAWQNPAPLLGLGGAILPLLTAIMFCMGLTLRTQDFVRIWKKPEPIALGIVLQFGLMPLIAWLLALALQLPTELATGLIVVGACAGGTASNVMTFIARGDVALSVTLTTVSTLWGLFLTPMLVGFYTQDTVEVDQLGMLIMIAQTVVLPIIAGVAVNRWMPFVRQGIQPYLPTVASAAILLIIGIIVAINASELSVISYSLLAAVILHNLSGLALGYSIARWNGHTEVEARTIAIEVGMQNSGLGVALANSFFGPMAAVPGVLFSIWQNISGSVLASFWKWRTDKAIAQQLKNRKNVL